MEDLDTEADVDEILISLVEDKALLYDKSSAQYKDNQKKNEAWIDIASRMFIMTEKPTEVKLIIKRWKTLKRRYMEERRRLLEYIPSGSGAPEVKSTWKYYTIMDFLKKYVQHRQTYSNFNLPDRANLEENSDGSEGYEDSSSEEHAQDLTEEEDFDDPANVSATSWSASTRNVKEANNYLLIFRDAWKKIPDNNRKKCFFKVREAIRNKKKRDIAEY